MVTLLLVVIIGLLGLEVAFLRYKAIQDDKHQDKVTIELYNEIDGLKKKIKR